MKRLLEKLRRKEQVTIVALGDSNTELTWHTAGRLNWVGLLHEALFETYGRNLVMMINAGRCGDTAATALARLDRDVIRFQPNLTIISFGMNDAGSGPAKLNEFANAIRQIVDTLRARTGGEILLRTPNPVVVGPQPNPPADAVFGQEWPGLHQGLYARRLVELALELDCPVVDHYTLWTTAENRDQQRLEKTNHLCLRMADPVHPNALGHLYFFRELARLFEVSQELPWEK